MRTDKKTRDGHFSSDKGFTLIETLVVIGIIGMIALASYPSILNSLETRALEGEARDVLMAFQRAKVHAVKTKLNHRVRFILTPSNTWEYVIEREETANTWTTMPGFITKALNAKFTLTVNLPNPDKAIIYSSLGFVTNYNPNENTVLLQSDKLRRHDKPDQREVHVLAGGSCRYIKSSSE